MQQIYVPLDVSRHVLSIYGNIVYDNEGHISHVQKNHVDELRKSLTTKFRDMLESDAIIKNNKVNNYTLDIIFAAIEKQHMYTSSIVDPGRGDVIDTPLHEVMYLQEEESYIFQSFSTFISDYIRNHVLKYTGITLEEYLNMPFDDIFILHNVLREFFFTEEITKSEQFNTFKSGSKLEF